MLLYQMIKYMPFGCSFGVNGPREFFSAVTYDVVVVADAIGDAGVDAVVDAVTSVINGMSCSAETGAPSGFRGSQYLANVVGIHPDAAVASAVQAAATNPLSVLPIA